MMAARQRPSPLGCLFIIIKSVNCGRSRNRKKDKVADR